MPVQNIRMGLQYHYFNQFQDQIGTSATNNNNLYFYGFFIY